MQSTKKSKKKSILSQQVSPFAFWHLNIYIFLLPLRGAWLALVIGHVAQIVLPQMPLVKK